MTEPLAVDRDGYVLVHRRIRNSIVFDDPLTLKIWIWCIMEAAWKEHEMLSRLTPIHLKRGQFVFGRHIAAQELNCSEKSLRTRMLLLEKLGNLAIERTNRFSVVTVCNYETYQLPNNEKGQQNGQQAASRRPADGQQTASRRPQQNTSNTGNERNEGEGHYPPPASTMTPNSGNGDLATFVGEVRGRPLSSAERGPFRSAVDQALKAGANESLICAYMASTTSLAVWEGPNLAKDAARELLKSWTGADLGPPCKDVTEIVERLEYARTLRPKPGEAEAGTVRSRLQDLARWVRVHRDTLTAAGLAPAAKGAET